MKFLVDTNMISEIRKRDRAQPRVTTLGRAHSVADTGTSILVLAESHGIELKRRSDQAKKAESARRSDPADRRADRGSLGPAGEFADMAAVGVPLLDPFAVA